MSNEAKKNREFVRSLNGRDKTGKLTQKEKFTLFVLKQTCPCLSCVKLDRKTFICPAKGKTRIDPYKPRVCNTYVDLFLQKTRVQKEDGEVVAESQEVPDTPTE